MAIDRAAARPMPAAAGLSPPDAKLCRFFLTLGIFGDRPTGGGPINGLWRPRASPGIFCSVPPSVSTNRAGRPDIPSDNTVYHAGIETAEAAIAEDK